jgi:hypothetical protein
MIIFLYVIYLVGKWIIFLLKRLFSLVYEKESMKKNLYKTEKLLLHAEKRIIPEEKSFMTHFNYITSVKLSELEIWSFIFKPPILDYTNRECQPC